MPDDDDVKLRPATRRRPLADAAVEEADAPTLADRILGLQAAADAEADAEAAVDEAEAPTDAADEAEAPDAAGSVDAAPANAAAEPPLAEPPADAEPKHAADETAETPPAEPRTPVAASRAVTKAPAKKAPATKAAAKKAPAKKAAAKKAPAKKAVPSADTITAVTAMPAPTTVPEQRSPRPAPPAVPRAIPAEPRDTPVAATQPAQDVVPAGKGGGTRVLLALTVLLLAAAVGMGAAAGVLSGTKTWTSSATVRLVPSESGTAVSGAEAFRDQVPGLTSEASSVTGVPSEDIREDLAAELVGADQVRVTARAAHADQSELLAAAGAQRLMSLVTREQRETVSLPADRISAVLSGGATLAERTSPSTAAAAVAGGLTGGGLLLLGLLLVLRPKKSQD